MAWPDRETMNVDAGEAFGRESHDDAGRVEETGVVGIAVDYGKTPPRFGKARPEDNSDIATAIKNINCSFLVI